MNVKILLVLLVILAIAIALLEAASRPPARAEAHVETTATVEAAKLYAALTAPAPAPSPSEEDIEPTSSPSPSPIEEPAILPVTAADWFGVPPDKLPERLQGFYIPTKEEVKRLTQAMYGEYRGNSITERAAVPWCVLNRIDMTNDPDFINVTTITKAINTGTFEGYSSWNPVWPSLQNLAIDVITRWLNEKLGFEDVGRVVPSEFTYFSSDGHLHNVYRDQFRTRDKYGNPIPGITYWTRADMMANTPYDS